MPSMAVASETLLYHILLMRRFLIVAIVVIAAIVAFNLGRRMPGEGVTRGPGEGPSSVGQGVVLDLDSIRATRTEVRRRIVESQTYLPVMLESGDSVLKRWPTLGAPLLVYISRGTVKGYRPELESAVRNAFARWERVGAIPVQFSFVNDSSLADVKVHWIELFSVRRSGQADVVWNQDGWLIRGTLTLATHAQDGRVLPSDAVHTVALHEIGHLLGLGHSDDTVDLMYPATSVHDLTPRDRRTARLLYALPPGTVRDP